MPTPPNTPTISVDLVPAAQRSEEFAGIPIQELQRDAVDYERFLLLIERHRNEVVAPHRGIDRMWHLHMLHPRAYHADCLRLFGEILDHDGGFGSEPAEEPILFAVFNRTAQLWLEEFGEPYVGEAVKCTRNCVSRCTRRCKMLERAA